MSKEIPGESAKMEALSNHWAQSDNEPGGYQRRLHAQALLIADLFGLKTAWTLLELRERTSLTRQVLEEARTTLGISESEFYAPVFDLASQREERAFEHLRSAEEDQNPKSVAALKVIYTDLYGKDGAIKIMKYLDLM